MSSLSQKNKSYIDTLSYRQMINHCRTASAGNGWLQGETGKYFLKRIAEMSQEYLYKDYIKIVKGKK